MIKRIEWVDIYKGLAIACIVIGHSTSPLESYFNLFHVAAFFFISGFTTHFSKYDTYTFIKKRIQSLLIPFFVFNILFVILHLLLKKAGLSPIFYPPELDAPFAFFNNLNGVIGIYATEDIGGAMWFLITLFHSQVAIYSLLYFLNKRRASDWIILVIYTVILFIGFVFYSHGWKLFYWLDIAFIGIFFVGLGNITRKYFSKINQRLLFLLSPLAAVILTFFMLAEATISFPGRLFHPWYMVLIGAIPGIILLFGLSQLIARNAFTKAVFIEVGKCSLWILALHLFVFRLTYILLYFLHIVPIEQLRTLIPPHGNSYWVIVSAAGIGVPLLIQKGYSYLTSKR
jgi:fucose 4-O-acetylase-like acetyltransferase